MCDRDQIPGAKPKHEKTHTGEPRKDVMKHEHREGDFSDKGPMNQVPLSAPIPLEIWMRLISCGAVAGIQSMTLSTHTTMVFMAGTVSPRINVIRATLIFLMVLTMGCQPREFMLTVSGEEETEGGHVFVNGKWVGIMTKEGDHGPQLMIPLPKGTLTVEVKKDGYLPFFAVMTVASQTPAQQIHVQLARDTISEEKQTGTTDQSPAPSAPSTGKLPICPD